jgi:hypothetical protein
MHVHHPREKNNKRTLQETQREKKIVVCIRIARENRPGRNAHTKNKYTPVQRTKKVIKCESSVFLLFLLYIYTYIKKYKVIDVSDQILKIDSELNAKKKIYERDWFGSHTYNRFSSLSFCFGQIRRNKVTVIE